ncbi:MAG TPA: hypothetical protein VE982_04695 [Gaiellaceae bacterium]|nr:hypothetical protein [Gaiellaceae bacterium]
MTRRAAGSTRETVPSAEFATHKAPAPYATLTGPLPTATPGADGGGGGGGADTTTVITAVALVRPRGSTARTRSVCRPVASRTLNVAAHRTRRRESTAQRNRNRVEATPRSREVKWNTTVPATACLGPPTVGTAGRATPAAAATASAAPVAAASSAAPAFTAGNIPNGVRGAKLRG